MTQPTKKLARLNSEVAYSPASNPVQDREERKLQYYMELFARQEKLQKQKLQQQPASQHPAAAKDEEKTASVSAPEKERKKPGRKPRQQPPLQTSEELPQTKPKQEEIPVEEKPPRKKPGRKSKAELAQLPQTQTQTGGTAQRPSGVVTRNPLNTAETIDEQTGTVGRRKIGLSVLAATPQNTTSTTPKTTTAVPREMSKPITTDDFATDPLDWAKQFIIYY